MTWQLAWSGACLAMTAVALFQIRGLRRLIEEGNRKKRRKIISRSFYIIGLWQLSVAGVLIAMNGWATVPPLVGCALLLLFLGRHPGLLGF